MEFNATFIVAFISFVIFILIMNFILYQPIYKIVSKRKQMIDDNYEIAKTNSSKSKVLLSKREDKLIEAKASSRQKYSKAFEDANSIRNEKITEAKKEARNSLEENKTKAQEETNQVIEPLRNEVINLAQLISDKILKNHEEMENIDNQYIENLIQG